MNKEKLDEYLSRRHFPLQKSFIHINNLIFLIANIALFWLFKNIIACIISGTLFIILLIVSLKNINYLNDYDSSLLVRASIAGYWFFFITIFVLLFQLKVNIRYWFLIIEAVLSAITFYIGKKSFEKTVWDNQYESSDFESIRKKSVIASTTVYVILSGFEISISQNTGFAIISVLLFSFAVFACFLFSYTVSMYISYIKLCCPKDNWVLCNWNAVIQSIGAKNCFNGE